MESGKSSCVKSTNPKESDIEFVSLGGCSVVSTSLKNQMLNFVKYKNTKKKHDQNKMKLIFQE